MGKKEEGFTLMEMLVVLFIIGVILAIALPNLAKTGDAAQSKAEKANENMLLAQAENYRLAEGKYPDSIKVLKDAGYIQSDPKCADENKQFEIDTSGEAITIKCR